MILTRFCGANIGLILVPLLAAVVSADDVMIPDVGLTPIDYAEVPAREAGTLAEVRVVEGDQVSADDLLAQIVDADVRLEVKRAEIARDNALQVAQNDIKVRIAQESRNLAELDLQRSLEAVKVYPESVTPQQIDRLRITLRRAELEVEQAKKDMETAELALQAAENELQTARTKLERRQIVAPIDGSVVEVNRRKGEWVEPGEVVARVLAADRLRAEAFVPATALTDSWKDRNVVLVVDLPGSGITQFAGKMVFVSPEANPVNGQVRIWAEIPNRHGKLRPGMPAKMMVKAP